jgi:citrate lyase subunit beta/citryl-CoA lyase
VPARGAHDEEARAMSLRSLLFVPGDSERKQAKAVDSGADALLLDLEDSVAAPQLPAARQRVRELLTARSDRKKQQLWVRVNALSSGLLLADLTAVMPGAPDGIVLPKVSTPAEVLEVSHYLAALEEGSGRGSGATQLLIIATETPRALLSLNSYAPQPRIMGLTWGAEDLSAALGVTSKTDQQGALTFTFQLARSLCVVTSAALGVQAIDGVHVNFRDATGLTREAEEARRDGFTGKLAIHPDQVGPINAAFQPSAAEIEWARRVVSAFAGAPDAGVINLDGRMVDKPHLLQARRILDT